MMGNERLYPFETNASTPSLRATDHDILRTFGVLAGAPPTQPEQDSANVKVVVRVRQFVQRGKQHHMM
jgi:hypothetical protein